MSVMRHETFLMTDSQVGAIEDILGERGRQDDQWGQQNHHPAYWLAILGKQVGQMGSAVLDREWAADKQVATDKLRFELVQAAAVALAAIECIDSGNMPLTLTTSLPADPRQLARSLDRGDESIHYQDDEPAVASSLPLRRYKDVQLPEDPAQVKRDDIAADRAADQIGEPGTEPCS